jgi:two-component system chemotaxis response regulator CheB
MAFRDIVGIGTSAGGVEALRALIGGFPASLRASVFIVLHIAAHTPSRLHEILRHVSALPVEPASDGALIRPGHIYVGVADRHLFLEGKRIRITRGPKENRMRPAVDVLFRSAAHSFGPRVIGVVLTGNLNDGTAGLQAVKKHGGIALVQSPEDALYPSMPQNALEHVAVDYVLSIAEMPQVIASLCRERVSLAQAIRARAVIS